MHRYSIIICQLLVRLATSFRTLPKFGAVGLPARGEDYETTNSLEGLLFLASFPSASSSNWAAAQVHAYQMCPP